MGNNPPYWRRPDLTESDFKGQEKEGRVFISSSKTLARVHHVTQVSIGVYVLREALSSQFTFLARCGCQEALKITWMCRASSNPLLLLEVFKSPFPLAVQIGQTLAGRNWRDALWTL